MFIGRAMQEPGIAQAQMFWRPNVPQLFVDVDREKAKALGVPIDEVFNALAATLGTYYVNDFNKYGRTWQVLMSSESRYRKRPDDVGYDLRAERRRARWCSVWRARQRPATRAVPDTLERFNNLPAVTHPRAAGAPGVEHRAGAGEDREGREGRRCPRTSRFDWSGASYQEKKSGGTVAHRAAWRAPSWRSSSSPRSTRDGRCRCP